MTTFDGNPHGIMARLDEWADKHAELSNRYEALTIQVALAKHRLEQLSSRAHLEAKARPRDDRATVADLDADVKIATEEDRLAYLSIEAELDAVKRLLKNAEIQVDVLRSHSALARFIDPRTP